MSKPRKILFRGKATVGDKNHKKGEFVCGNLIYKCGVPAIYIDREDSLTDIVLFVDPATVGQFTGFTDKNGKEIFEGDIIECLGSKNDPCRHIVRHSDERGGYVQYLFQAERITVEPFDCGLIWQQYITDREKYVIGNIHDNKV